MRGSWSDPAANSYAPTAQTTPINTINPTNNATGPPLLMIRSTRYATEAYLCTIYFRDGIVQNRSGCGIISDPPQHHRDSAKYCLGLSPLAGRQLPEEFATLHRLLEARMGKQGKRKFVQVLRLIEAFKIEEVAAAVRDAIARPEEAGAELGGRELDPIVVRELCKAQKPADRFMRFNLRNTGGNAVSGFVPPI
jgi:hypothetical protein